MQDSLKVTGELQIVLKDKDGNIILERSVPNLVVTSGKYVIASKLGGQSVAGVTHIELGLSSISASVMDTALVLPILDSRTAILSTLVFENSVTYTCTFPAGTGTGNITEAGLFNASSGPSLIARTVFTAVPKTALDSLTIFWKLAFN